MAMPALCLLLTAVQTIVVPRDRLMDPVRVPCTVNQTVRIVFPEPLRRLRTLQGEDRGLGVTVETTKPRGVIVVHAATHPSRRTVEFRGPDLALTLVLESVTSGGASEVRVVVADSPTPPPAEPVSRPSPSPPSPAASASPMPAGGSHESTDPASLTPPGFFTPADLLRVSPVRIQRREGLPGQDPMVLVDALHGDDWIWLRFRLEGGAASRVRSVSWEHGAVTRYIQEADGRDLRIVVQLPRSSVTRKTRVSLKLESGPAYRFALNPSTFPNVLRDLFKE
jgi:hypothetical protein